MVEFAVAGGPRRFGRRAPRRGKGSRRANVEVHRVCGGHAEAGLRAGGAGAACELECGWL
eukprot:7663809-Lingulodinium_polyedra.AAC.1